MQSTIKRLRNEDGFTLIELMIVIVVLGILAGIVLFALGGFDETAKKGVSDANTKQCKTAVAADKAAGGTGSGYAKYLDGSLTCTVS